MEYGRLVFLHFDSLQSIVDVRFWFTQQPVSMVDGLMRIKVCDVKRFFNMCGLGCWYMLSKACHESKLLGMPTP